MPWASNRVPLLRILLGSRSRVGRLLATWTAEVVLLAFTLTGSTTDVLDGGCSRRRSVTGG